MYLPTSTTDKEQIDARKKMWKKMDENGDGHIQYSEAEESL